MNKEQQDKLIKLCAYFEAKVSVNEDKKDWSNIRLVHYGLKDILRLIGVEVLRDNHFGDIQNKLVSQYKTKILEDKNFEPKEFKKDLLCIN